MKRRPVQVVPQDVAAIACGVTDRGFAEILALSRFEPDTRQHIFWSHARSEYIRRALQMATPAVKILPAKLGSVAASLGMGLEDIRALARTLDVTAILEASSKYANHPDKINPFVQVEFDQAVVYATISDAGCLASGKSWGHTILSVKPLEEPLLDALRILYRLKPTSHMRQRWEWRDTMKAFLGKDRSLVTEALRRKKRDFLAWLAPDKAKVIAIKLDLDAETFWRASRRGEDWGPFGIDHHVEKLLAKKHGIRFEFSAGSDLAIEGCNSAAVKDERQRLAELAEKAKKRRADRYVVQRPLFQNIGLLDDEIGVDDLVQISLQGAA